MAVAIFFAPTDRGLEAKIREKLAHLKALAAEADQDGGKA
jgi:hypothetical protein